MSFQKATKSLAKQLDPTGDLIPVRSVIDHDRFRPLCLVQRKRKRSWWQSCPFHKTEYKLGDVLLSGNSAATVDVLDSGPITIVNQVDGTVEGELAGRIEALTTVELKGTASMTHAKSVKLKKIHACHQLLDSTIRDRTINMNHEFIKQSRMVRRDLYVITEAVETMEETEFGESNKAEGSMFYKAFIDLKFKGGGGSKKAIIIPKACILAFRVKQLRIKERETYIVYYRDEKTGTFDLCVQAAAHPDDFLKEMEEKKAREMDAIETTWTPGDKSKALQIEVKQRCAEFSSLSSSLCGKFLTGFLVIMREKDFLEELVLQLEQALECKNPYKLKASNEELQDLVENLQDSEGDLFKDLVQAVLYFLQALDELTDLQLMLLAKSVERKIVNRQLQLVESFLDNAFSEREGEFTADVQHLSEEDLDITGAVIEMCGVTVHKKGSSLAGAGNPDNFSALGALYVALYALNALST